jgi:hypothetical protein
MFATLALAGMAAASALAWDDNERIIPSVIVSSTVPANGDGNPYGVAFVPDPNGIWFDPKTYPSVPYLFNLLMDPMEKMDPESHEWGYTGR